VVPVSTGTGTPALERLSCKKASQSSKKNGCGNPGHTLMRNYDEERVKR